VLVSAGPLLSVAAFQGDVYAGGARGLWVLRDDQLVQLEVLDEREEHCGSQGEHDHSRPAVVVRDMRVLADSLWVVTDRYLWRRTGDSWGQAGKGRYMDLCLVGDEVVGASQKYLFRLRDSRIDRLNQQASEPPIRGVRAAGGSAFVLREDGVLRVVGRGFVSVEGEAPPVAASYRDVEAIDERLFVMTRSSLHAFDGSRWVAILLVGLPAPLELTCLARGRDRDLWLGTTKGFAQLVPAGDAGPYRVARHVTSPAVRAVAVAGGTVYAATDEGLQIAR
jgi:hypothetical protein